MSEMQTPEKKNRTQQAGKVDESLTVTVSASEPISEPLTAAPGLNRIHPLSGSHEAPSTAPVQIVSAGISPAEFANIQPVGPAGMSATGLFFEVSRLFAFPILILGAFAGGIAMIGYAQHLGWLKPESGTTSPDKPILVGQSSQESNTSYICPMMCVPPTTTSGRCPVCGMELVKAAGGASSGPSTKIQIDPRARRVAGIETVAASSRVLHRDIRGVGEISYDETRLKTLAAYIDGRIEELYADYTGIEVKNDETLALIFSPDLYSAQVEYVKTLEYSSSSISTSDRVASANSRLQKSSRQRLIELGLTELQVDELERSRSPLRRFELKAPISGTVIEKLAVTGQYVKAGDPIYRLADLRTVWLVLQLFPQDAASIDIGQEVNATTQSGHKDIFTGTVEFIEPTVDPIRRTVGVRVAIPNTDGKLKPGEFASATLHVPVDWRNGQPGETVVIPRNSLLSTGETSLAYVEIKPGEFEMRQLRIGPTADGLVAVYEGIKPGEQVVARSTFLLDAQMQLQGNPSLIDPTRADMTMSDDKPLSPAELDEIRLALEPLNEADRMLAEKQVICPVTEVRLGSMGMGTPVKLEIEGRTVFICCEGCRDSWMAAPEKYFQILDDYLTGQTRQATNPAAAKETSESDSELPQMELPVMELPVMELPKMKLPRQP